MELFLVTALVVATLFVLLSSGMPIAVALLISGAFGLVLVDGSEVATSAMQRLPVSSTAVYTLVVVPMFVLMGAVAKNAGIAERTFDVVARYLRPVPGGLALAALGACAGFAAVSGSSIATVVTIGRTSVQEMTDKGYDRRFAAGVVGAAGTLGVLIPPSIAVIIFGVLSGVSIGQMLIAGIIPGILTAILYAAAISVRAWRQPHLVGRPRRPERQRDLGVENQGFPMSGGAPGGLANGHRHTETASSTPSAEKASPSAGGYLRTAVRDLGAMGRILILFAIVVGGIYTGVVTVIEAAAFGAFAAILIMIVDFAKRPRELWSRFRESLNETVALTGMVFGLIIGATVFTRFTVAAGIPQAFTRWATGLDVPPMMLVIILLLAFVPMGMFLDPLSILLIGVPIAYPVVQQLGYDGLWFGILVIKLIEIGMITPPVGLNAFVLSGTLKDLSVEDAFRGILWFLPMDLITVALILVFPSIVTWLPALVSG